MFSITPTISNDTLWAICAARRATFCAVAWGVVTITNCACGSSCASVIETSPVPGGRSIRRKSSAPQATSWRNWVSALCSIGPRHTTAASSSRKKPIDITFTPCASNGRILRSAETGGRVAPSPYMRGIEEAHLLALARERRREVRGERRLAHAALAGADAEHVRDLRERPLRQRA